MPSNDLEDRIAGQSLHVGEPPEHDPTPTAPAAAISRDRAADGETQISTSAIAILYRDGGAAAIMHRAGACDTATVRRALVLVVMDRLGRVRSAR